MPKTKKQRSAPLLVSGDRAQTSVLPEPPADLSPQQRELWNDMVTLALEFGRAAADSSVGSKEEH